MMYSNIIGVVTLVAIVVAHPPVKKNGYSIVTHHEVPKKAHNSEWVKPSGEHTAELSWNHGEHDKGASSYSSLTSGGKHSEHKPLAWSPPSSEHDDHHDHEKHAYPKYKFNYGVSDPHTGDNKKQWESRDGDLVKGAYQINDDKNGAKRLVEYKSSKHSGFHVDVKSKLVKSHHSKW